MDLTQLKRFVVAAESGSLRRAAQKLHLSQPALTQSMQSLEDDVGAALFVRGARGVTLTEFGAALMPRARLMLSERERIAQDLIKVQSGRDSEIKVGVAPYFTQHLLPVAITRTLQGIPDLKLQLVEAHTSELCAMVREGALDLAFCVHNRSVDGDPGLQFEETYTEVYSVMARSAHPLLRRRRVREADLAACTWIVYDRETTAGFLRRYFEDRQLPPPAWAVSTLSLSAMIGLISQSDLVALLPRDFTRADVAAGRLRKLAGHAMEVQGRGGILSLRGAAPGRAVRELAGQWRIACEQARGSGRGR